MIDRISRLLPDVMINEVRRILKVCPNWVEITKSLDGKEFRCRSLIKTWLASTWQAGSDGLGIRAITALLRDGPKLFRPSISQCDALEQVEVNLCITDYQQPYPALVVDLPEKKYNPFLAVLCHFEDGILVANLISHNHRDDIVTVVSFDDRMIEQSLTTFDEECSRTATPAILALRVSVNSCLALVNYGNGLSPLLPKEVESDTRLAKEDSPRGQRARERLPLYFDRISFNQEVILHNSKNDPHYFPGSGREISTHWRRGCWAMQPYGPNHTLRKRIFRKPCLVRSDLFIGDKSDTSTTYHS